MPKRSLKRAFNYQDEYYTPKILVDVLIPYLKKYELVYATEHNRQPIIWLPFDTEESRYYTVLKENGFQVVRSHLNDEKDFFTYQPEQFDLIVSNPPFSKKDQVLKRAYSFNKPFALLLPVNTIQGKKRFEIFHKDIQLLCFDVRVDYHTCNNFDTYTKGNHFGSAYFCRMLLPSRLEMRRLNKYEKPLKLANQI